MNKGFSLIELLAVIIILAIISLITFPIVNTVIKSIRESADASQSKLVIDAAKLWVNDNSNLLSDTEGDIYTLTFDALKEGNYVNRTELNDLKDSKVLDNACVKITTEAHKYSYEFEKECQ